MSDTLAADWMGHPVPKKDAERRAAIRQSFTPLEQADARIARAQADINRLKAETRRPPQLCSR